jgi:hypothetical protein
VPRLLEFPEAPRRWAFHETESSRSLVVEVDVVDLLRRWLSGEPLPEMADALLGGVRDRSLRIERLVDAVSDFCEHYLAWMLGALIEQVNVRVATARDDGRALSPELATFVRYGVNSAAAVHLLTSGLRSREIASRVAASAASEGIDVEDLRPWLGGMALAAWRENFDAGPSDLLDLLEYSGRAAGVLASLLRDGTVTVGVDLPQAPTNGESASTPGRQGATVVLQSLRGAPQPAPLVLVSALPEEARVATVPTSLHADLQALLDTGLEVRCQLDGLRLTVRLTADD